MYAKKRNFKKLIWILILILSVVLIAVGIGVMAWTYMPGGVNLSDYRKVPTTVPTEPTQVAPTETSIAPPAETVETAQTTELVLPENPIDFSGLQKLNPDVYAWIYIPNTDIDLPVLQANTSRDDNYYMHRDIECEYDFKGSIYSQRLNKTDFSDPVTVLYGHHMLDDSMFSNLHYFRDDAFFEENRYFYIYTPGHILTYEIVSAHEYDERHILNSFNFSKPEIFQEYIDYILAPKTMVANVREGVTVTTEDRIVTLSTCTEGGSARYLLQGVLINDERTAE